MILDKILKTKQEEVAAALSREPLAELEARIGDLEEQPRGFARALRTMRDSGGAVAGCGREW